MAPRTSSELNDLIKNLRTIRRHHEKALADIQVTFRAAGMEHLLSAAKPGKRGPAATAGKVGRGKKAVAEVKTRGKGKATKATKAPKSAATGTRRKRAKYSQTAEEFILSFLGKHRTATTSEIRQHWQKQGRGGKAENSLTGLVKTGKLVRTPRPGQAGSSYSLPASSSSSSSSSPAA